MEQYIVFGSANPINQYIKSFYKIIHYSVWYSHFYKQKVTNFDLPISVANIVVNIKKIKEKLNQYYGLIDSLLILKHETCRNMLYRTF